VVETIIIHPFGNGNHTTYKNGDEWGMVYDIVLPTLYYRAIPVSSIFGQHDAVSILLTLLIVKLVEAPGQRAGTGLIRLNQICSLQTWNSHDLALPTFLCSSVISCHFMI
jgi:hypothetical protein